MCPCAGKSGQLRRHLASLALVDRVENQPGHAVEGQKRPHGLVGFVGFAVVAVAARHQNAGIGRLEFVDVGHKQQGGDVVFRLTLIDDFFDPIAVAQNHVGDLRIQRGTLGQAANGVDKLLAKTLLVFGNLLRRLTLLVLLFPVLEFLPGEPAKVVTHHFRRRNVLNLFGQDTQFVLAESRCG